MASQGLVVIQDGEWGMAELPLVGEEFAGYRLVSVLGRGGMSIVFRAENPRLGNVIALKVLDPALASDDIFRTRFLEESRIAASMNHPNVIPIHDMGSSDGLLYIAMRCVSGSDLRYQWSPAVPGLIREVHQLRIGVPNAD